VLLQKRYSVCKVEAGELYEKGQPKAGGLSDPRLGTMDKHGGICTTDGAGMQDCPGYFGHIELAQPVYHCGFIKTVVRVLRCVSHYNSRLLISPVRAILSCSSEGGGCVCVAAVGWAGEGQVAPCKPLWAAPQPHAEAETAASCRIAGTWTPPHQKIRSLTERGGLLDPVCVGGGGGEEEWGCQGWAGVHACPF
jgi:hypothetical protein